MTVSVLIVDDHAGFRASARKLLELAGFAVVGEAESGVGALELARRVRADLVLLDVALPDASGFAVGEQLAGSGARVVLTSSREPRDLVRRVRETGVLGFVAKEQLSGEALRGLLEAEG